MILYIKSFCEKRLPHKKCHPRIRELWQTELILSIGTIQDRLKYHFMSIEQIESNDLTMGRISYITNAKPSQK